MKTNLNLNDRMFRILVGAVMTFAATWGPANPWYFIGLLPLFAGITGWSPSFAALKINNPGRRTSHDL